MGGGSLLTGKIGFTINKGQVNFITIQNVWTEFMLVMLSPSFKMYSTIAFAFNHGMCIFKNKYRHVGFHCIYLCTLASSK